MEIDVSVVEKELPIELNYVKIVGRSLIKMRDRLKTIDDLVKDLGHFKATEVHTKFLTMYYRKHPFDETMGYFKKQDKIFDRYAYHRVVGYYRPVQNFNNGKKEEFNDRTFFEMKIN
jgi:hypothetical protein